jgi:hypothetical protein
MPEEFIAVVVCLAVGLSLVCFPRQIAAWSCRHVKNLLRVPGNEHLAKLLRAFLWVVERASLGRVHDEASAPKAFRFFGYMYLWTALMKSFFLRL